jgi:cyanophycin synthetase
VVKPVDCEGGKGVTVNIDNNRSLHEAYNHAKKKSRSNLVLIEKQIEGICHRLYVYKNELIFATKRNPVSVQADGLHSIKELISIFNETQSKKAPWLRVELPADALTELTLKNMGYSLDSVPEKDKEVALRPIESTQWGGKGLDVTDKIHPDNVELAIRCTRLFGLHTAGIDMITQDISRPWYDNGAMINEVNYAPLFGVFEVTKPYVKTFLQKLINGDGRIPIDIFLGNDALADAKKQQTEYILQSKACFLINENSVINPNGETLNYVEYTLYACLEALLFDKQVGAIVIVIQNPENLQQGLPVDRITKLHGTFQNDSSTKALNYLNSLLIS